jgi:hypothetical protein
MPEGALNTEISEQNKGPSQKSIYSAGRRIAISLFILTYLTLVEIWVGPTSGYIGDKLQNIIRPVVVFSGLDQQWTLFSPVIRNINFHSTAVITFQDGSTKLYEWPRMEKLSFFDRWRFEKMRKFMNDCMPWPEYRDFWPALARFLTRANLNPKNQPTYVSLAYNFVEIPTFGNWTDRYHLPEHIHRVNWFVYKVIPKDLQTGAMK